MVTHGQRGGGRGETEVGGKEVQTIMYKMNKLQRYIAQHREYSQYFIISLNGT